jgi:hypothetical protein
VLQDSLAESFLLSQGIVSVVNPSFVSAQSAADDLRIAGCFV